MWGVANKSFEFRVSSFEFRVSSFTFQVLSFRLKELAACHLLLATCYLLLFALAGCSSVDPVLKVGLVGPFEGVGREIGYDVIYSARLAVRQVNETGGIGGYRLALVALDDSGDPQQAQKTAESLILDPAVIAVVGNWLTETTAVSAPLYAQANLPFLPMGQPPFGEVDPANLPATFRASYEAVTPFDEQAGPYAGSAYDSFQLLWLALAKTAESGPITRQTVQTTLTNLEYQGMTGTVYQP